MTTSNKIKIENENDYSYENNFLTPKDFLIKPSEDNSIPSPD